MSAMMSVAAAEETRQVDKHEHGVGELNIGRRQYRKSRVYDTWRRYCWFEYEAKSDSDIALVNTALSSFKILKTSLLYLAVEIVI